MRTHCFISSTFEESKGVRWSWHTRDPKGRSGKCSEHLFATFQECVDDARAHGYNHVEVPRLDGAAPPVVEFVPPVVEEQPRSAPEAFASIDAEIDSELETELGSMPVEAANDAEVDPEDDSDQAVAF